MLEYCLSLPWGAARSPLTLLCLRRKDSAGVLRWSDQWGPWRAEEAKVELINKPTFSGISGMYTSSTHTHQMHTHAEHAHKRTQTRTHASSLLWAYTSAVLLFAT